LSDLDWPTSRLRIERSLYQIKGQIGFKPTKTRQARTVTIPLSLIEYLKIHREQQQENRNLFGTDYRADLDLIFSGPDGSVLKPDNVSGTVRDLAIKAGLKGVKPAHPTSHHASTLLASGVPIANVSKRLGHRNPYTTAKIYQHALPDTDQDVATTWDKLMAEKRQSKPVAQNGTKSEVESSPRQ
jgi:integrase